MNLVAGTPGAPDRQTASVRGSLFWLGNGSQGSPSTRRRPGTGGLRQSLRRRLPVADRGETGSRRGRRGVAQRRVKRPPGDTPCPIGRPRTYRTAPDLEVLVLVLDLKIQMIRRYKRRWIASRPVKYRPSCQFAISTFDETVLFGTGAIISRSRVRAC